MEPFHLFHFSDNFKNIGIKLSGGADSSIVYYGVCDYYKDNPNVNIYALTMYTDEKSWYPEGSKKVINQVKELTGVVPTEHFIFYASGHNKDLKLYENGQEAMTDIAIEKYKLDVVYSGLSKNPPVNEMINFFKLNHEKFGLKFEKLIDYIETRDITRDIDTPLVAEIFEQKKYSHPVTRVRPFINCDKKETYNAYNYYNMLEKLYPLTNSCEVLLKPDEDRSKFSGHCGHCFFCLERWYGFDKIV